jgi:putative SOS response-associated peptidase YedK
MCGRFTLHRPKAEIVAELQPELWDDQDRYQPAYNIAPGASCVVVAAVAGARRLGHLRWGLIPSWADDESIGNRLINARSETLRQKPSFRGLVGRHHCAVLMDGYFEWQRQGARKQPHLITRADGRLLLAAALWDSWTPAGGERIRTFTIVTVAAPPALAAIHERMPALLRAADLDAWLTPATPEAAVGLLGPGAEPLRAVRIAPLVNSPAHNTPAVLEPLEPS